MSYMYRSMPWILRFNPIPPFLFFLYSPFRNQSEVCAFSPNYLHVFHSFTFFGYTPFLKVILSDPSYTECHAQFTTL